MLEKKSLLPKTWIEIDGSAIRHNYRIFRGIVGKKTQLWSVVKSNAYGHGIGVFPKIVDNAGVDGFCVDSVREGFTLRREGIKKPILVIGSVLPDEFSRAAEKNIMVSVATFDDLKALVQKKRTPTFHIKIDTGMHRRGFFLQDVPRVIRFLKKYRTKISVDPHLGGIYTHFASAKDLNYPTYTDVQYEKFKEAIGIFKGSGYSRLLCHAAATAGALAGEKYHFDAVRVGIGLYGLWPSKELEMQLGSAIALSSVLSWRAKVSEVKNLIAGSYIGYDLAERITSPVKAALLPVGYWHGIPRSLSHIGTVLIRRKRARIIGRVSMDIVVVDATNIPVRVGDVATIIGYDGNLEASADMQARFSGTTHYEFLARLNPLMERYMV